MKQLVLYSGSLQSLLALASEIETREKNDETYMMVFDYGQKNMTKFSYAQKVAEYYKISEQDKQYNSTVPDALSNGTVNKIVTDEHFFINNLIPDCIVSDNKELTLIQIGVLAIGYCIAKNIDKMIIGTSEEEYNAFDFEEVETTLDTIYQNVHNPSLYITYFNDSRDSLDSMLEDTKEYSIKVPFELAMTCEKGEYPLCGECSNCKARKDAFTKAGVTDTAQFAV